MNMKSLAACLVLAGAATAAPDWYKIDLNTWSSLEVRSDRIQISKPAPNWDVSSSAGACGDVKYIQLIPPTPEMQKTWLAAILAAQSLGKSLWVFGDCKPSGEDMLLKSPPAGAGRIIIE